jgi:hypothetical protein
MESKTKDQGIHRDPTDKATDDAAEINEGGGDRKCKCTGSECHFEWTDD